MSLRKLITTNTKRAASLVKHSSLPVYYLEGQYQDQPLRLLVADDGYTLPYMQSMVFPDGATVSKKPAVSAFNAHHLAEADADMVVVGANYLLQGRYGANAFRIVPKWVRLFLPTRQEPYERLYEQGRQTRKYFKWMLKKVKDAGFVCEVINDREWLPRFYQDMYEPYAAHRYGEAAVFHDYVTVKKTLSHGGAIIVRKNEEEIAAVVFSLDDSEMRVPHFGAYIDKFDEVRDGANFALDFFTAELAHQKGCDHVDFGHSRPFLSDGVLRYKLNWHMDPVEDDDALSVFAIATPGQSERGLRFLEENPFFEYIDGEIRMRDE